MRLDNYDHILGEYFEILFGSGFLEATKKVFISESLS